MTTRVNMELEDLSWDFFAAPDTFGLIDPRLIG